MQYHNKKDETVHLLSGKLVYRVQSEADLLEDVQLQLGESFRITPGTIHQIVALTDCDVLEVSTPELDDVVRLSDKYGREGTSAGELPSWRAIEASAGLHSSRQGQCDLPRSVRRRRLGELARDHRVGQPHEASRRFAQQ